MLNIVGLFGYCVIRIVEFILFSIKHLTFRFPEKDSSITHTYILHTTYTNTMQTHWWKLICLSLVIGDTHYELVV